MSTTNRRKQERKSKLSNTSSHNEPKSVAEDEDNRTNRLYEEGTSGLGISGRPSYKQDQTKNLHRHRHEYLPEAAHISNSETAYISDSETDSTDHSESVEPKLKPNGISYRIIILVLLASVMIYFVYSYTVSPYSNTSNLDDLIVCMDDMKEKFPRQDKMFWRTIINGINYTANSQHPTSFIFLYEDAAETTIQKLMVDVSKCVGCIWHMCNSIAVNFNKEILESEIFSKIEDYGSVITHLKDKLENNGMMIVENLDTVPEKFALAFHTICDEDAPLVKQSTVFFTMKMDKFEEKRLYDLRYVYNVLKGKWNNVEHDEFEPLLTRISSMPLRVYPEEH